MIKFFIFYVASFALTANARDAEIKFIDKKSPRAGYYLDHIHDQKHHFDLDKFYLGKKLCDKSDGKWNSKCQDAAFRFVFGPKWKKYRKITKKVVNAYNSKDFSKVEKYFAKEVNLHISHHSNKNHDGYVTDSISKKGELYKITKQIDRNNTNLKYEDVLLHDRYEKGKFVVMLNKDLTFGFIEYCAGHENELCIYHPKIDQFIFK